MRDWTGNTQAVMATLNASSHSENDRAEFDYYATPRIAVTELLRLEQFNNVWEPACGELHISNVLEEYGVSVRNSDIVKRGEHEVIDFLETDEKWDGDIITNPPFAKATEFVYKAMDLLQDGGKLALLLRVQFLEGVARRSMYAKYPPKKVYIASRNLRCAKNGDFANATGNASTYCWFIWEKGVYTEPVIGWFNDTK